MRFNFRKISALATSMLMVGMTAGTAMAANYPAPFVVGGAANVAIVYGTGAGASVLDSIQSGNIQTNLQSYMGSGSGSTKATINGETKSLNSGSDFLYLLDDLAENGATVTKDDLPTILAREDFVDDNGGSWKYDQTIVIGSNTGNRFSFGNSGNDLDDPALMLELQTSTSNPIYTWTINFDKATNLNASISEGEEITFFGKTYTIGTATDGDTLVLQGGSSSQQVGVGETVTMTVGDVSYTVTLDGLSTAGTTEAGVTIDGVYKTFTAGQSKKYVIGDVKLDVFVKTVFRTGDDGSGHIQIELGSGRLTFEASGSEVKFGSDNKAIDGTLATITGTADNVLGSVTKITVAVSAGDNEDDHVLVGEAFTDPVFETLKLDFAGVLNGPAFGTGDNVEQDVGRSLVQLKNGGDRELQVKLTDSAGVTETVPFAYQNQMRDDNSNPIVQIEGNNLTKGDYFFLNSGDFGHLMEVTRLSLGSITASDIEFTDVFSGEPYTLEDKDFTAGVNITINSQTYTVTNNTNSDGADGGFKVESADAYAQTHRAIFPYLELVAGEDFPRVTFVNQTNAINDGSGDTITAGSTGGAGASGRIYELPTGSVQFTLHNNSVEACTGNGPYYATYTVTPTGGSATTTNMSGTNQTGVNMTSIQVGEGWYTFGTTTTHATTCVTAPTLVVENVTLDIGFDSWSAATEPLSPVLMFVEDKDKSDSDARNVILVNTTDDGTYSEMNGNVLFSGTAQHDDETWDDTKMKGYLTNYGTYTLRDQTDTNQHVASLSYGSAQMYADVYLAGVDATITSGTSTTGASASLGDVIVKDSEVSSVSSKNLVVVGGSCINSVAANLVGGALCGSSFTDSTGVGSGQFLIQSFGDAYSTGQVALLVAGYEAADTVNAATYLRNQAVNTDAGNKYIGTSSTSAEMQVA